MTILDNIRSAFSAETRQKIYATAGVLIPALVTFGLLSDGAGEQILLAIAAIFAFATAVLQLVNFTPNALASWFVNGGRLAIYALAGSVLPVLVFFDILPQDASAAALANLSSFLSTIAALVGIYFAPAAFGNAGKHASV